MLCVREREREREREGEIERERREAVGQLGAVLGLPTLGFEFNSCLPPCYCDIKQSLFMHVASANLSVKTGTWTFRCLFNL